MAKYLVTGGCGFIGSHLVDALLAAGNDVRILDDLSTGKRDNVPGGCDVTVGDVTDRDAVHAALDEVDGCFHLAAVASVQRSIQEWVATHRINLTGTVNIFDAARAAGGGRPVPVVYASSAAVYGDNPDLPLSEESDLRPLNAYGADKLGSELHGRVATLVHGVPTTGFRMFNVYGPRQDPASPYAGVISIFADRIGRGAAVRINGDGEQDRDFVYVGDAVRFLIAGMEDTAETPRVFNVCTGMATRIVDLAGLIGEVLESAPDIQFGPPLEGEIRHSRGDPSRAANVLGVTADTALRDGLAAMLK